MKDIGIRRRIDELGRLVLPKELRDTYDIRRDDPMQIYVEDGRIIIEPLPIACDFCRNTKDLVDFQNKKICKDCIAKLTELAAETTEE